MFVRSARLVLLLSLVVLASGCQSAGSGVRADFILPSTVEPFDVNDDQTFYMADLVQQPMPVHPVPDGQAEIVVTCVEVVVDPVGDVAAARPLVQGEGCPSMRPGVDPFLAAAIDATREWKFIPAAVCNPAPESPNGSDCEASGGTMRSVAVTLGFRFVFERRGTVTARAL